MMSSKNSAIFRSVEISLKLIGAYPDISSSKGFILIFIWVVLIVPFQIFHAVEAYGDLDKFMNNFAPTLIVVNFLIKFTAFRINHRNIQYLIKEIVTDYENIKEEDERKAMLQNLKISGTIYKGILMTYNCLACLAILASGLSYLKTKSIEEMEFIVPTTYPFLNKTVQNYFLLDFMQITQIFFISNGHGIIEGLLAILVFHAATQAHGVRSAIQNYSELCLQEEKGQRMKNSLKGKEVQELKDAANTFFNKHRKFLMFIKNVEDAYSYVILSQLFFITVQMCFIGYVLLTILESEKITLQFYLYLNFFICDLWGSLIYCLAGEHFTKQGDLIYEDLCDCPWYEFHIHESKTIIMLFVKAQKPIVITSGKFSNLSLIYFTSLMKTSFSYLSMIRAVQVRDRDNSD